MIGTYSHVSFDLDGTLVHTKADYRYRIIPAVLVELGGQHVSHEDMDEFWFGAHRGETIRNRFGLEPDAFWECFHRHDTPDARSRDTVPYPDAVDAIRMIREAGKTISVITGAPSWIADIELAKLQREDIDHVFAIKTSRYAEKPCPDSMHHVLRSLGREAHETLYIGNALEDALFAEAAGCDFVLVDRGECVVRSSKPIKTIRTLRHLFESVA